jgi:hypothetical protein
MLLEWWNGIVHWFNTADGRSIVINAIIPFLAILIGALLAASIARGSTKRLIAQQDRQHKAAAVATLIASGRKAAIWSTLTAQEKEHVEHQCSEAEVRVRLLPVSGAAEAADWAAHHLASMKKNSANYSFQADQDLIDFQDGLIAWQDKPARAKKLFAQDLAGWKYEGASMEDELVAKQREWAAQQPDSTASFQTVVAGDRR